MILAAQLSNGRLRRKVSERPSQQAFLVTSALTVLWCGATSSMGVMPMPGGWNMSMAWMRTPGQSWAGAASSACGA
jgi:hypothetical protein